MIFYMSSVNVFFRGTNSAVACEKYTVLRKIFQLFAVKEDNVYIQVLLKMTGYLVSQR